MATLTDAFLADLDALSDGDDQAPKEENVAKDEKVSLQLFMQATGASHDALVYAHPVLNSRYHVILLLVAVRSY